jgi:hypothetical protein
MGTVVTSEILRMVKVLMTLLNFVQCLEFQACTHENLLHFLESGITHELFFHGELFSLKP